MRLRQLCLIAEELEPMLETLSALLEAPICYRDPELIHFGLANGLLEVGGDFLETVSPVQANTAGGRHLARHGDSGYMVILQCQDAMKARAHITGQGVRAVWQVNGESDGAGDSRGDRAGVVATHFHPRDVGAAIVSIDSMGVDDWRAARSRWFWAGEAWQQAEGSAAVGRFAAAEIAARDPEGLARHWAKLLNLNAREEGASWHIALDGAELRFTAETDGGADRLIGIDWHAGSSGAARFYDNARNLGLNITDQRVHLCGVKLAVV